MQAITLYNDSTGMITGSLKGPDEVLELNRANGNTVDGEFSAETHYIVARQPKFRPANPAQLDGLRLSKLPPNTVIHIGTEAYPCPAGFAELEFEFPGTYQVRVECWPHVDKEFTVENPA